MRRPIVAGNWKMYKTVADAVTLVTALKRELGTWDAADVVLCPPFTALHAVGQLLAGSRLALGAQNMYSKEEGAFTGEISPVMLKEVQCRYVILGHSERREKFGETDVTVNEKVKLALKTGLTPIVCVGERLEQRDSGQTQAVVRQQVAASLAGLGGDLVRVIVAYEPVWAIGSGRTATPAQAQEVHALIRELLASLGGTATAQAVRIQYGGSVKPENAVEIFAQPDVDGGLIGGAALKADSFTAIVKAATSHST